LELDRGPEEKYDPVRKNWSCSQMEVGLGRGSIG